VNIREWFSTIGTGVAGMFAGASLVLYILVGGDLLGLVVIVVLPILMGALMVSYVYSRAIRCPQCNSVRIEKIRHDPGKLVCLDCGLKFPAPTKE
jgi:hypothetical protein